MKTNTFIKRASSLYPTLDFSNSEYGEYDKSVTVECKVHKFQFEVIAKTVLQHNKKLLCPLCRRKIGAFNNKNIIKVIDATPLSRYKGVCVNLFCIKHGEVNFLARGKEINCPKCIEVNGYFNKIIKR